MPTNTPHAPPTAALSHKQSITTVVCVYKTGGAYTAEYVRRLAEGVTRHTTRPHRFLCFTDSTETLPCDKTPLTDGLPGWWSKLELFKEFHGRTVYFDLDTMIIGNIDPLLDYAGPMAMLHFPERAGKTPPRTDEWGSGIMVWNSPMQFIYPPAKERLRIRATPRGGDQEYIAAKLHAAKWKIDDVHAVIPAASYKLNCRNGAPPGTRIVYFHGHPRPHEIGWQL